MVTIAFFYYSVHEAPHGTVLHTLTDALGLSMVKIFVTGGGGGVALCW